MSYAGVGLTTARGSGTSGYVQRNAAYVKPRQFDTTAANNDNTPNRAQATLQHAIKQSLNKANTQLSVHDQKRQIMLKCAEYKQRLLQNNSLSAADIELNVKDYRRELLQQLKQPSNGAVPATNGSAIDLSAADYQQLDTREQRQAKQLKNERLAAALKIGKDHESGSFLKKMKDKREAKPEAEVAATVPEQLATDTDAAGLPEAAPRAEQFLSQLQPGEQPTKQSANAQNTLADDTAKTRRKHRRSRSRSASRSRSPSIHVKREPTESDKPTTTDKPRRKPSDRSRSPDRRRRRRHSDDSASDSYSSSSDYSSSEDDRRTSKRRRRYSSDDSDSKSDSGSDDERDRREYEKYKRQRQRRRSYSRSRSRSYSRSRSPAPKQAAASEKTAATHDR